eukprot:scaffold378923_cov41-Prasinocladus_malaysianus.AAC.1
MASSPRRNSRLLASTLLSLVEKCGTKSKRSEAFICGPALIELGVALELSEVSELVLAPSAVALSPRGLDSEPRGQGCICMRLATEGSLQSADLSPMKILPSASRFAPPEETMEMVKAFQSMATRRPQNSKGGISGMYDKVASAFRKVLKQYFDRKQAGRPNKSMMGMQLLGNHAVHPEMHGLEGLATFVPQFVWQRCMDGIGFDSLAENRRVAVLFLVSSCQ